MMLKEMKGRAVIIAISEFHNRQGESLDKRKGVKRDANRLFKVLTHLDYKVSLHMDVSAKEIKDIYQKESKMPQGGCFISILSSHGDEGLIYDFYGEPVLLRDLYNILAPHNSPLLAGVPKLFFVQVRAAIGDCTVHNI
ncbi:caspase-7-like [Xenopus laevis]|uniref:Caspase-7-like n=1 Tax=Xenopus laevis TaxID=8355 RepID=A0A8J1MRH5_XENLA|nr:caspase-7-like [Xenopus laevis]